MRDFHALWKNWPTLVTEYSHQEMLALIRAYFYEHYGDNAEVVGDLHLKVMDALGEYIDQSLPELSNAVENIPDRLAQAVFFLVVLGKIHCPTPQQIELVEQKQIPKN
ncbi:MAG: hypothetical protein ABJF10_27805 [Chthoniobacter sp.]|uniref:hypothetical protein n=1 Tax=Chthoniobacter sp. TaxID=2510640 RepID=UPI0032A4BB4F